MSSLHFDTAWHSDDQHGESAASAPVTPRPQLGQAAKPVVFTNIVHTKSAASSRTGHAAFLGSWVVAEVRRLFSFQSDGEEPLLLKMAHRAKRVKS